MASTFTAFLKFNKPALGDAGWGTAVNGGFTDLVDQAITGFIEKAMVAGANSLGSIASGASSDARNQFILLTGTLASSATLTVPAGTASPGNNKLYFIKNTAGYEVTITNGGASTVVVPDGKSMMLRSTSDGVEEAMTHQFSLSLGTALAATSGGTGYSSYAVGDLLYAGTTTTLAKLAAVATGSVLRAKGVGTAPAWEQVVLTTDVTGVLPAANGGTGLSSPGALGNVLRSDGAGAWTSSALASATTSAEGLVELATDAEVQTGTDTTRAITPAGLRGGALVFGTVQAPTSGTTVDFTSIPSWVKRITVVFRELTLASNGILNIRLGTGGVVETTDYYGLISYINSGGGAGASNWTSSNTMRIAFGDGAGATVINGSAILTRLSASSNVWALQSILTDTGVGGDLLLMSAAGTKELAGALDTLQVLVTVGTFVSGSVNIMYE